jgi:hypothetical protein
MSLVQNLFEKIRTELSVNGADKKKNAAMTVVGFESADEFTKEAAKDAAASIESAVVAAFESAKMEDGINVQDHVLDAVKKVAVLATDPVAVIKNLSKNRKNPEITAGSEAVTIDATIFDADDAVQIGYEAFDGQNVVPSIHFSVLYNAMVMQQDDVVELFFPIIPIDPKTSGATVSMVIDSVIREVTRTVDGNVNKPMFDKTPLVKIVNDPDKIDVDKNRLVPVLRDQSAAKFVAGLSQVVNYNGESVTTAPLKVNEEVNLLSISQTDSMLARGVMDETDALDANVRILGLYASLTGKDDKGNDTTEQFRFDLSQLPAHFTYSTRDHNKDIILGLDTDSLGMVFGETKTAQGADSVVLGQLPEGYSVKIRLVMNGAGNTQYGDVAVYVNKLEMVALYDAAGNQVPATADVYTDVKAVFDTLTPLGYDVEAYLTNTNARMRGLIVTSDRYTEVFTVPYRTGITVQTPVVINGDDGDL